MNPNKTFEPNCSFPLAGGRLGWGLAQRKSYASTLSLALMELLAIRLGWQTTPAKSLVIPLQGGGNGE